MRCRATPRTLSPTWLGSLLPGRGTRGPQVRGRCGARRTVPRLENASARSAGSTSLRSKAHGAEARERWRPARATRPVDADADVHNHADVSASANRRAVVARIGLNNALRCSRPRDSRCSQPPQALPAPEILIRDPERARPARACSGALPSRVSGSDPSAHVRLARRRAALWFDFRTRGLDVVRRRDYSMLKSI